MQMNRRAARTYRYIANFQEATFLQNVDLILENVVKAFFLAIIKGTNSPTQAQLVHETLFLCKNI